MKRKKFTLAAVSALCLTGCGNEHTQQPNIVFIYADDMGIGDIGCYGQQYIRTPYLDRMAKEGMIFTNHYSGSAVSSPSRSCLMTGLHSGHTYIRANFEVASADSLEEGQLPLPPGGITIASMLKEAGYITGAFGKWGLGSIKSYGNPNSQGFDCFFGYADQRHAHSHYPKYLFSNSETVLLNNPDIPRNEQINNYSGDDSVFEKYKGEDYSLDLMIDQAKGFIRNNHDKPFFAYIPVIVPHRALQVPDEELEQYKGMFDESPYLGEDKFLPHRFPKSAYAGMISRLDKKIGEIIDLLKSLEIDDNTIVIFSSDNGPCSIGGGDIDFFNSAMGLSEGKRSLKEGGIRAPLIVRWPGKIKAGRTSDILCAQYDFLPTFADIARIPFEEETDGISLVETLLGEKQKRQHSFLYWEYIDDGGQQAVRFDKYKAYRKGLQKNPVISWSLYDLTADPHEDYDIAASHPDIITRIDSIARNEHTPSLISEWNFVPGYRAETILKKDSILLSVKKTKDGHYVFIDDETLENSTDGIGNIRDYSISEIKHLMFTNEQVRITGKSIPSLEEILVWSRGRADLFLHETDINKEEILHIASIYKTKINIIK